MRKEVYNMFLRSKLCLFLCFILFAVTYGFSGYFISLGMTGFSLLHTIARFNYYLCFLLVCLTYFYVAAANRNYVKEISEVQGHRFKYERIAISLIVFLTFFWNLGMCVILLVCSFRNDGSVYFLTWFPMNYFFNVALPQLICVGLTFFVSSSENTSRWLMIEIFFLFLISPFAEEIQWVDKPSVPIDTFWKILHRPFEILYQNGEWSPDFQNDFQLEWVRIFVSLFWIVFLVFVGMISFGKKKIYIILSGMAVCVCLFCAYQPASVYRLNSSWNGINKDFSDYELGKVDEENYVYCSMDEAKFVVKSYDLKLTVGNELRVEGDMDLTAQYPCEEFNFTLYHGYEVIEVSTKNKGITITSHQNGDMLSVRISKPVTAVTLHILYKGHHNKFYANSRAILLPGWFAWYPMAGSHQIILTYPEHGKMWGYNPYNRISKAKIRIQSNCELITNIKEKSKRIYEGEADSITVLSGNIVMTQDAVVKSCLPLALYAGYRQEDFIAQQKLEYTETLKKLNEVYGIDTSELESKTILIASKDMGRNLDNNFIAVFDDYLLAAPNYISVDNIMKYLVLGDFENQKKREESEIIQIFLMSFLEDEVDEIIKTWIEKVRMQIEHPEYFDQIVEQPELFLDVLQQYDSEKLIKKVAYYVMNPEMYGDDNEFLEEMRDEM